MESYFIYFAKVALCSAIMFAYYFLALRNRTFHHYNRFYLIFTVLISLSIPFLKVSYFTVPVSDNINLIVNNLSMLDNPQTKNIWIDIFFVLVAVVFFIRFLKGIIKIGVLKRQFKKEKLEGISFYLTNLENAPFSFFRNLFWKDSILINSDLGRQILKHEMVHIEQKHSLDKIFMEIVTAIFWFNPVFWFIKKEINLIHEYLADKKAVKKSDTKAFAQMLLASHFSGNVIPGTSPFLSSNLKKRLKMLRKPKTKFGYAHRILALPVVFILVFAYAVSAQNKDNRLKNAKVEVKAELKNLDKKKNPDLEQAMNAPENALFIVGGKEVSKKEYINAIEEMNKKRELYVTYQTIYAPKSSLFGKRGDNGYFRTGSSPELVRSKDEYRKLVEKYNPLYKNDRKLLKGLERDENMNFRMVQMDKEMKENSKNVKPELSSADQGEVIVVDSAVGVIVD